MRNSCRGFLPQNDVIKLQWAVLEACQAEAVAQALGILLKGPGDELAESGTKSDEDPSQTLDSALR